MYVTIIYIFNNYVLETLAFLFCLFSLLININIYVC